MHSLLRSAKNVVFAVSTLSCFCAFKVFLTGWENHSSSEDFEALLIQLHVSPTRITRVFNSTNQTSSFFLEFDTMKEAREVMVRKVDRQMTQTRALVRVIPSLIASRSLIAVVIKGQVP